MIELDALKERMTLLRAQKKALEERRQVLEGQYRQQMRMKDALAAVESFCAEVGAGLESLDFEGRQKVLRLVLDQVVVEGNTLRIEAVIPTDSNPGSGNGGRFVDLCPPCLIAKV
jgi:hypothetical protein